MQIASRKTGDLFWSRSREKWEEIRHALIHWWHAVGSSHNRSGLGVGEG
jgi:hypothetical protein